MWCEKGINFGFIEECEGTCWVAGKGQVIPVAALEERGLRKEQWDSVINWGHIWRGGGQMEVR